MVLKFGIDDAGRGPVIGPMILAGCVIKEEDEDYFKSIGAKDSKLLTQKKRVEIEKQIIERAVSYSVKVTDPDTITDTNLAGLKLNELEAIKCADIINDLNTGEKMYVVLDCPSPNLTAWNNYLKERVNKKDNLEIVSEHKADFNHVSVACGSILAKCERERQMDELKKTYPNIGSGYPADPKTKAFLAEYAIKLKDKNIFRKTWATYKKVIEGNGQKKLF